MHDPVQWQTRHADDPTPSLLQADRNGHACRIPAASLTAASTPRRPAGAAQDARSGWPPVCWMPTHRTPGTPFRWIAPAERIARCMPRSVGAGTCSSEERVAPQDGSMAATTSVAAADVQAGACGQPPISPPCAPDGRLTS